MFVKHAPSCRLCAFAAAPFLLATILGAAIPANLPPFTTFLKANTSIQTVATDAQGYIYVFGDVAPSAPDEYPDQVFVARLDPAASKVTYVAYLGGSSATYGEAMTVDAAGNAYVTGYTDAADFTTVPYAPGPSGVNAQVPFVAKVNINGTIVYSTLFSNGARGIPQAIAVDGSGEAVVSGISTGNGFPVTQGAYNNAWSTSPPFTTKLSANGSILIFSVIGVGGSRLALDSSGNVFIAGTSETYQAPSAPQYPTTPGAFQLTFTPYNFCSYPTCMFGDTAGEQYVTKLSADGSKLIYSTFVTGSKGAYNAGMAVDAVGDVWLTGDTNSPDYPYTQDQSAAAASQTYTTELDPTGSKVLLSVPVGVPPANGNDLAIDPQGNLIVVGTFPVPGGSTIPANALPNPAGPSAGNTPPQCLPGAVVYVMRISSQDGSVLGTQFVPGVDYPTDASSGTSLAVDSAGNIYVTGSTGLPTVPLTPGVFYDTAITGRAVSGTFLERTNFSAAASAIGCITDSTSMTLLGPVAPGQLITIYGNGIGPVQPVVGLEGGEASVPTGLGGVTVTFDGQPAPILYASSTQINVQAPFEIYQKASTVMQLSYNGTTLLTRAFAVVPENPNVFVGSAQASLTCNNITAAGALQAFALNEDGTINSCANPAAAGSQFSLFVNGTGTSSGNRSTGAISGSTPQYINGSAAVFNGGFSLEVDAFTNQAGAISGVGQITARVPPTIPSLQMMDVTMTLNGLPAGPLSASAGLYSSAASTPVVIFVKP